MICWNLPLYFKGLVIITSGRYISIQIWLRLKLLRHTKDGAKNVPNDCPHLQFQRDHSLLQLSFFCRHSIYCGKWVLTNARSLCIKFNEFALFVTTQNSDIVCVTETRLHTDIPDSLVCPNGYCVTRCDRNCRDGGIAILVRNSVKFSVVDIPSEFSALDCIDVPYGAQTCRIIGYYRSPGCSAKDVDYMLLSVRCLQKLCSSDKVIVIMGDARV